jgi:hypothetical protein
MPVTDTTFFRNSLPALCVNNWRGLELRTTPWTISTKSKGLNYLMVSVRQTNYSFSTTITLLEGVTCKMGKCEACKVRIVGRPHAKQDLEITLMATHL